MIAAMKFITYSRIVVSIAFGIGCVCGCLFQVAAHAADAGTCYTISDSDARTYCLARAHKEPAQCYSIKQADMRAQCMAEVRK